MSWKCPECGEINSDDSSVRCSCGYMEERFEDKGLEEFAADIPRKKPLTPRQKVWKTTRFIAIVLLFAWLTFISKQTAGRPYFMGKVFAVTAFSLSAFCIYPASKVVGPGSILLAPVRMLRDGLFNIGWKFFPEDDGERVLQWFGTYYLVNPLLDDMWYYLRDQKKPHYSVAEYKQYLEDINRYLEPLATLPMKDKISRRRRYRIFFSAAKAYSLFMGWLLQREYGDDYYTKEAAAQYMKNIRHHFQLFLKLRERTRKLTPQVYNDFATFKNKFWINLAKYRSDVSAKLIYEDYSRGELDCSGDLVQEFLQAREDKLLHLPEDYRISKRKKAFSQWAIFRTDVPIAKGRIFNLLKRECKNPEVQRYPRNPTWKNNSRTTGIR